MESLLATIAQKFDEAGVGYMVIGGQAALRVGRPRFTQDIDLTVAMSPADVQQLLKLCADIGLMPRVAEPAEFVQRSFLLPLESSEDKVPVDIAFGATGFEAQAIERAEAVTIGGVKVRFATAEDLIVHKMIAHRAIDIEDTISILRHNPGADIAYVRRCLSEMEELLDRPLVQEFEEVVRRALRA